MPVHTMHRITANTNTRISHLNIDFLQSYLVTESCRIVCVKPTKIQYQKMVLSKASGIVATSFKAKLVLSSLPFYKMVSQNKLAMKYINPRQITLFLVSPNDGFVTPYPKLTTKTDILAIAFRTELNTMNAIKSGIYLIPLSL